MLLVITPNPDVVAETFVRQHIELICPDRTVVVYFEGEGMSIKGVVSLKLGDRAANSRAPLAALWNLVMDGYRGSLVPRERQRFVDFMKAHGVQAVLAEQGQTGCAVRRACLQARVPLFVYFHGYDATGYVKSPLHRYAYRRLGHTVTGVFCGSSFLKKHVRACGIPGEKISIIPCGLQTDRFRRDGPGDPNLVVAVGRFVEKKAPHLTVQAFATVAKTLPEARLEMIGDGPLMHWARQAAKACGVADRVVFHGAKDHDFVQRTVSRAAVFLQHSVTAPNGDTESLGVSLLEAMASEVPVVVTRHNGFPETIVDGKTGFLVEEYDVEQMAAHLQRLLQEPDLRRRMGKTARQHVIDCFQADDLAKRMRSAMHLA